MEMKNKTRIWLIALLFAQIVVVSSSGAVESTGDFFGDFDADGDGVVSQDEFSGPGEHFGNLDANEDGYISAAEGPSGPPGGDGPDGGPGGDGPDGGPGGDGPGGGPGGPGGDGPNGRG